MGRWHRKAAATFIRVSLAGGHSVPQGRPGRLAPGSSSRAPSWEAGRRDARLGAAWCAPGSVGRQGRGSFVELTRSLAVHTGP